MSDLVIIPEVLPSKLFDSDNLYDKKLYISNVKDLLSWMNETGKFKSEDTNRLSQMIDSKNIEDINVALIIIKNKL